MENINNGDFIDVYVLKTLNEIKNIVKREINLEKNKEEETDKKMFLILKNLINSNFKNLQRDPKGNLIYTLLPIVDKEENEKVRLSMVLYYTALYYDNIDLLKDLLKENIQFERNYRIKLQYLDKSISSKFDREEYIRNIKNHGDMFINFAESIDDLSEEDREKYIIRFFKLFNMKYEDICEYLKNDRRYCELGHLFDKNNLDTFEDNSYKNADLKQLELINRCHRDKYQEETCVRLNHLIQNTSFSNYLCDYDLMMRLYNDEELFDIDNEIARFLSYFSKSEEMLNKALEFIKIRPSLAFKATLITRERFMSINNYLLIEMLEHMEKHYLIVNNHNLDILSKTMIPKTGIKRLLKIYKRNDK